MDARGKTRPTAREQKLLTPQPGLLIAALIGGVTATILKNPGKSHSAQQLKEVLQKHIFEEKLLKQRALLCMTASRGTLCTGTWAACGVLGSAGFDPPKHLPMLHKDLFFPRNWQAVDRLQSAVPLGKHLP